MTTTTKHNQIIHEEKFKSTNSNDTPRIYVACLASYNEGKLFGQWIDLDIGYEFVQESIRDMLADSPSQGEEWAIHDYENIPFHVSEWEDIPELCETIETLLSCDYDRDLVIEVKEYFGFSFSEAVEYLEDNYVGEYENLGEWAEDFLNETGQLCDLDKNLIYYFDYDAYGRDSEINGDILHLAGHVLYNN